MTQRFKLSPETNAVVKKLESMSIGDFASYADLSALVGGDIQGRANHYLQSARRVLRNEKQYVFGVVTDEGVKRLNDEEIVLEGSRRILHIRRASRTAMKTLVCVSDFEAMTEETKKRHNTTLSVLGAINLFSKPTSIKKIDNAVAGSGNRLQIGETIAMFGKTEPGAEVGGVG